MSQIISIVVIGTTRLQVSRKIIVGIDSDTVVKIDQSMSGRYLFGQLFSKFLMTSGNDASHPSEMTHEDETPVIKAKLVCGWVRT